MTPLPLPLTRDLVLVGGGHTHALVLRRWGMDPLTGVRLTLVNPGPTAPYSGMLPGHVAGHYPREALEIDLVRLCRFAGARLVLGAASGLERRDRMLLVQGRGQIAYDLLSFDIGVSSSMPDLPGFADHAVPAKPLGPFAARWRDWLEAVADGRSAPQAAVIGGGVAGAELAMAIAFRLSSLGKTAEVTLIDAAAPLGDLTDRGRRLVRRQLDGFGIAVIENASVTGVTAGTVELAGRPPVAATLTVGAAGARPHGWLERTGLDLTSGYITVGDHLRALNDPAIYAVGDCAHLARAPRPKAGVYAVRQAPVLHHNLVADLSGGMRKIYRPQSDYLKLVSLGRRAALAQRGGLTLSAPFLWRLKDRIDRRFMDRFDELPAMADAPLPARRAHGVDAAPGVGQPLCAGCGAKVGPAELRALRQHLPEPLREDVIGRPGDDAAILRMGDTWQVITTDHMRAITPDPWLMARIAAAHALGDVWAMGAAPQAALANLVLPPMSASLQQATIAEITTAAAAIFRAEGAELVGGHTSTGAELTLGFTITGLAERPLDQKGAAPGDALILTGFLGSGVLLAGEMAGRASGADIAALWREMTRSRGNEARILAAHATAMTDITGFGLAGHILSMAEASGCRVHVDTRTLSFHPGAETLARAGLRSTLMAANRDFALPVMQGCEPGHLTDLLFDPQTCGGLLAAVPQDQVAPLLQQLQQDGVVAAAIGRVEAGTPELICT